MRFWMFPPRRIGTALGLVPWWAAKSDAEDQDPTEILPQVGDHFVYLTGPMEGQVVKSADLTVGPQVQAYPADPGGRVVTARVSIW